MIVYSAAVPDCRIFSQPMNQLGAITLTTPCPYQQLTSLRSTCHLPVAVTLTCCLPVARCILIVCDQRAGSADSGCTWSRCGDYVSQQRRRRPSSISQRTTWPSVPYRRQHATSRQHRDTRVRRRRPTSTVNTVESWPLWSSFRQRIDVIRYDTILYDTRCYFNGRSKADISHLKIYRTEPTIK